jgi:hypothetical protein
LADTAAESDALSTAGMVLDETEITGMLEKNQSWLVFPNEKNTWRSLGRRACPPPA